MKAFICIIIFTLLTGMVSGQVKTGEKKTTVNPKTGDTTYTESVTISETEDITPRSNLLVINPLKFLLFYNISYFHKISEGTIIGGGIQIPTISGIDGFGINAEVRVHPSGKNMRGFYLAPNFSYNHLTAGDVSTNPISMGFLIGWQWFPGDEFAIGLGIGVDYYTGSVDNHEDGFGNYDGTAPALRFDIGYAW